MTLLSSLLKGLTGCNHGVGQGGGLMWTSPGEGFAFRLTQGVGRIQFLAAVELKTSVSCWLAVGHCL